MKQSSKSSVKKTSPEPRKRPSFPLISDDMKHWSAMLQAEMSGWPGISTRSMFGFVFYYCRGTVFAALPLTRGFDSPSSLVFKFDSMPANLRKRTKADTRIAASMKASSKGWLSFELSSEGDLREALFWLNRCYEAAKK
jgi:hypothetical protein